MVRLHIHGANQPIIVVHRENVLGRASADQTPTIDLTEFRAYALGVSRRHAMILFTDEGCLLKDLGSANGTWLNRTRLPAYTPQPLHKGDQIALGQLMMLVEFVTIG